MTKKTYQAIDELDNESRVRILGIIDKFRELGVSENVSLPQLVVVGDQSSGKSSLLEGLTGISFPVATGLCTRFATQIILRRAPKDAAGVVITIIPGPSAQADEATKAKLLGFKRELSVDDFDNETFLKIFDEAAEAMGVPGPKSDKLENLEKRFSEDILKIESSSPEHQHLSIVDVPGLFHNPTKQQAEEDEVIIRKLIENWITDKRTIILGILDARNNRANQGVLQMARTADPAGQRTVGIITKCDGLLPGEEQRVLRIAKNEVEKLTNGWFAVKNRSAQEIQEGVTIEGRHQLEKTFFATTAPWTELKKDRVGIQAVKSFLAGLLYNHIRNEFPAVIKDIEELSASTQKELELLGPSRQTTTDQRRFLTHIATSYEREVRNALSGNYDADLEPSSPLKLRMHIRRLNETFASTMARTGHSKVFRTVEGIADVEFTRWDWDWLSEKQSEKKDIYEWIREIYQNSLGPELSGTVNPAVLENMFRQQSHRWEGIAAKYLRDVLSSVHAYNEAIFSVLIPDNDLKGKLTGRLSRLAADSSTSAQNQLSQILNDERGGILQTVNHYFVDNLTAIREERVRARLKALGIQNGQSLDMAKVMKGVHISNEDRAVYDLHDILKAYYKVALNRFTDNVIMQVTERLVLGPEGPVKVFSSDFVGDLEDNELRDIADKNFATSSLRNKLVIKCARFKAALDIVRQEVM